MRAPWDFKDLRKFLSFIKLPKIPKLHKILKLPKIPKNLWTQNRWKSPDNLRASVLIFFRDAVLSLLEFSSILALASLIFWFLDDDVLDMPEITALYLGFVGCRIVTSTLKKQNHWAAKRAEMTMVGMNTIFMVFILSPFGEDLSHILFAVTASLFVHQFILRPTFMSLINFKKIAGVLYKRRRSIVVLYERQNQLLEDVLSSIEERYDVELVLSLSHEVTKIKARHVFSMNRLEKAMLSPVYWMFGNPVRQVICVAGEGNPSIFQKLLAFCAEYNLKMVKLPYLDNLAKAGSDKMGVMPITIRDIIAESRVGHEERQFLLKYFRDKSVWINYNGEHLIKSFICAIARSGINFLTVFVPSERHAEEISTILKNFDSLPYGIKMSGMKESLAYKNIDRPDVVLFTLPVKDSYFGFDNTCHIFSENSVKTIEIIDACASAKVQQLFVLTDISAITCTNWVGITHRIVELYATSVPGSCSCSVVRIPFSEKDSRGLFDMMEMSLLERNILLDVGNIERVVSCENMLNSLVCAISKISEVGGAPITILEHATVSSRMACKLFLNLYGLRSSEGLDMPSPRQMALKTDVFEVLKIELKKMPDDHLYTDVGFVGYPRSNIKNMLSDAAGLLKTNNMSGVIDLASGFVRRVYNEDRDDNKVESL